MTNYINSVDRVFHALADPTRLAVVEQLCQGPASVKELAAPFEMALPSFLQHLRVLESEGLVVSEKQGRVRTYRIAPKTLNRVEDWITHQRAYWESALDRLQEYADASNRSETE
ncbi:helix-turn-helix transcriptional regulator [Exilibacterium tricleocarpae]|uniref:Helix-turn-helix transcriptional regulator n=1 Tax=Exilibacterium tricleocarpae TaxID=2591008 RepID=A0A545TLG1_9GAMM|nr:metalloregulator ArsR/SmtB family transcription factor [Exilibacterium tricleocarpae]TQV78057.1 helix-turn-helix transcriptional regulator [Exilibacterium tricleocarpae]